MGYIPALYDPLRLVEEIAIIDQMLGGRMELGLVRGSIQHILSRLAGGMRTENLQRWSSFLI